MSRVVLAAVIAAAVPAHADSSKLADARRAVESVDYDAARRLLLDALHDGDNSPSAVGEIYRLSARAAVVLGERDVAEQYYRRWLAIDASAALPPDTSPKLREPFLAAQAYMAAHGRLIARAQRISTGEIDVELVADPLAMARAATLLDGDARSPATPFGSDRHLRLAPAASAASGRVQPSPGARIAIVDDHGNRLLELEVAATAAVTAAAPIESPASGRSPEGRPWTRRWLTWAIPAGVFGLGATGFGIAAIATYGRAQMITSDSGRYFLSDAQSNIRNSRTFTWIAAGAGVAMIGFGIPTAIYFFDERRQARAVIVPTAGDGHVGATLAGRF